MDDEIPMACSLSREQPCDALEGKSRCCDTLDDDPPAQFDGLRLTTRGREGAVPERPAA